jgi:hypothetical protein
LASAAAGPDGSVYVGLVDQGLAKVTPDGKVTPLSLSVPANTPLSKDFSPRALAVAADGNVYVGGGSIKGVGRVAPDGKFAMVAGVADGRGTDARFEGVEGIALARSGTIYVLDRSYRGIDSKWSIQAIATDGTVRTVLDAYRLDGAQHELHGVAIAVDSQDRLLVAEQTDVVRVAADGKVEVLAGDPADYRQEYTSGLPAPAASPSAFPRADGPGSAARFTRIRALAIDDQDNAYVLEDNNVLLPESVATGRTGPDHLRKVHPEGTTTTLALAPRCSSEPSMGNAFLLFDGKGLLAVTPAAPAAVRLGLEPSGGCSPEPSPTGSGP